jgi:inhibitor-of-growth protein 1
LSQEDEIFGGLDFKQFPSILLKMMQNQAAVEALYSATFVEDYLDYVENVPDDIQRFHTMLRELDLKQHQDVLVELETLVDQFTSAKDAVTQKRLLNKMMIPLINSQDIGDDKIQLVQNMADIIENKTRQLDYDSQNLDFGKGDEEERTTTTTTTKPGSKVKEDKSEKTSGGNATTGGGKRKKVKEEEKEEVVAAVVTGGGTNNSNAGGGKSTPGGKKTKKTNQTSNKKRGGGTTRKVERERSASPAEPRGLEIDPDEPTYCLCDEVSYGEMIGCDNDLCPIEWFHFNCVGLSGKPKGKWFCPFCRGDKPTVMKPKAQFLKDLDKYNKEKEEKMK